MVMALPLSAQLSLLTSPSISQPWKSVTMLCPRRRQFRSAKGLPEHPEPPQAPVGSGAGSGAGRVCIGLTGGAGAATATALQKC